MEGDPASDDGDGAVQHRLRAAIDECPELEPTLLTVAVSDGIAVLTGRARSAAQRAAATTVALRVIGVREVDNRIDVHASAEATG